MSRLILIEWWCGVRESWEVSLEIQDGDSLASLKYLFDFYSLRVLMKIINKQSIIGIGKRFIWAKLRTIVQKTVSQITLRNCSKHSFISCQNKECQTSPGYIPSTFEKNQISMYIASQYGLGTWEGSLTEGVPALASQEGRHLMFIFNMAVLYFWSPCPFPLIIKADVQCRFDKPRTVYFS